MRKKIFLFLLRLIRLFRKEESLMPELSNIPYGSIRIGRFYTHYGRILFARPNPQKVIFLCDGKEITELAFTEATSAGTADSSTHISVQGKACHLCCCERYGLPCRCDFSTGSFSGYYELIHSSHQYSDNLTI